jgi:sarcosine oxidase
MTTADVAVIGLGAMGSAALYHLSRRRARVVGIEQFTPGHDRGSSHGQSRIIRLGYFEHPSYVPLVRAAVPLWRALERESGEPLLHVTGILEAGRPGGELVRGTLRASREHGLAHEVLDVMAAMRRFPQFTLAADMVGVFQPDGGFLAPESAIAAHVGLAASCGADVRVNETVRAIEPRQGGVHIVTDRGVIEAGQVVVAAGPWLKTLLPALPAPVRATRQVFAWFEPANLGAFAPGASPVFMIEDATGIYYGFPPHGGRVKFAKHHHQDETIDPTGPVRPPSEADVAPLRGALARYLPAANGPLIEARTCLYTITPDSDFILDRSPDCAQIIVVSPCSGHGFKFSPVIGEIVAALALDGATAHDISRFRLDRFA